MYNEEGEVSPETMLHTAQKTKGYLFKKSRSFLGGWQKRYFLIINHSLIYYPDETLETKKGVIELSDINRILMRQNNQFVLEGTKRVYQFRCQGEKQKNLWVASLNLLKETSDMSPTKRFLIRDSNKSKKKEWQAQNQTKMLPKWKQVLLIMELGTLAQKLEQPRIYKRIFCYQWKKDQFYIVVSIKTLGPPELDEQLLPEKYIQPYEFNKIYQVNIQNKGVQEIGKMSLIQSFKTEQSQMVILFSDKKKLKIPLKNQHEAHFVSQKVCRCYQVAKQYYNPFKIILKKNIDRIVWLYNNHKGHFEDQAKYRVAGYFQKYKTQPHEPVTMFLSDFHALKKSLMEIDEACRVFIPPRDDIKSHYIRIAHTIVCQNLKQVWQSFHDLFQSFQLLKLATQVYQFWILSNQIVNDTRFLDGCCDLTYYFLRKNGQLIKSQIQKIHYSKVQSRKIKNQLLSNQVTNIFYEWLVELVKNLGDSAPIQKIFEELCKFFVKAFDQYTQYLNQITQKWTETLILVGACNDVNKTKKFFLQKVGFEICQGIIPESKFQNSCGMPVAKKLNNILTTIIKKIFLVVFSSIEKRILSKPFLQLNIAKICYEVLQRLQPFKNKVDQEVEDEIIMLSFDEICFFFFTCLFKRKFTAAKNSKQVHIKSIQKGITQIQQYYCNIKTQSKVKEHLKEVLLCKQVLQCPQNLIPKYCKQLRIVFGLAFNQQCVSNVFKIRQSSDQSWKKYYLQCCEALRVQSSQDDSLSRIQSQQTSHNRPRTSTLTQSVYMFNNNTQFQTQLVSYIKNGQEGYLKWKKVQRKGIPTFSVESYFRIKSHKLLQYQSKMSTQPISFMDLSKMQKCSFQHSKDNTFVIDIKNSKYYYETSSRDEAGKWIQAIYSQTKSPMFQNTLIFQTKKQAEDSLFKDFDGEVPTTATLRQKTFETDNQIQVLQQKRNRRIKQTRKIQKYKNNQKGKQLDAGKKKQLAQNQLKYLKQSKLKKQDEGSCCSAGFF